MALSTRGRSPDSRDPSHSNGEVNGARKVVSNWICQEAKTARQVSRRSRMQTLHGGLLGLHVENDR